MASKQQRRPIKTFRGGFLLCDLYLNINDIKGKALSRNFSIYFDWSTFVFTQIIRTSQVRTVLRKQKIQLFRKYQTKFFGIVETEPYATICTWSQHGGIMESKVKKKNFQCPTLNLLMLQINSFWQLYKSSHSWWKSNFPTFHLVDDVIQMRHEHRPLVYQWQSARSIGLKKNFLAHNDTLIQR